MKFKYFIRGLGVGMIFSAMILLAAYQSGATNKMSDTDVIRRAKELGMVEKDDTFVEYMNGKDVASSEENVEETTLADELVTTESTTEKKKKKDKKSTEESKKSESTSEKASSTEEKTSENMTTEQKTTEKVTTEQKTTEQKTTEKKTTEQKTTEQKTTEEKTTEQTGKTVEINVKRGASSYPVCQMLQEQGVIKDASDFDNYLIENGYASRIRVGTHKLKIGMSYHDIAEAISDPL